MTQDAKLAGRRSQNEGGGVRGRMRGRTLHVVALELAHNLEVAVAEAHAVNVPMRRGTLSTSRTECSDRLAAERPLRSQLRRCKGALNCLHIQAFSKRAGCSPSHDSLLYIESVENSGGFSVRTYVPLWSHIWPSFRRIVTWWFCSLRML